MFEETSATPMQITSGDFININLIVAGSRAGLKFVA